MYTKILLSLGKFQGFRSQPNFYYRPLYSPLQYVLLSACKTELGVISLAYLSHSEQSRTLDLECHSATSYVAFGLFEPQFSCVYNGTNRTY